MQLALSNKNQFAKNGMDGGSSDIIDSDHKYYSNGNQCMKRIRFAVTDADC